MGIVYNAHMGPKYNVVIVILLLVGLYFIFIDRTMWGWTLMICKDKHENGRCNDNSFIIEGYWGKNACMSTGEVWDHPQGYMCGNNCKTTDYGLYVCKDICTQSGCTK